MNDIDKSTMLKLLDWAYDKAIEDGKVTDGAIELAESYMAQGGSPLEQANSLIRMQNTKTFTTGFLTGFGGFTTLIASIPADLTATTYIQLRMIASIAHIAGYNVHDDEVRTLAYTCLLGDSVSNILKEAVVIITAKTAKEFITNRISEIVLSKINQAIGSRLVTKAGTKGVINIVKVIPVIGGVVSGTFNGVTTNTIGNTAVNVFINNNVIID